MLMKVYILSIKSAAKQFHKWTSAKLLHSVAYWSPWYLGKMELTWQWYEEFSYCYEARKINYCINSLQRNDSILKYNHLIFKLIFQGTNSYDYIHRISKLQGTLACIVYSSTQFWILLQSTTYSQYKTFSICLHTFMQVFKKL